MTYVPNKYEQQNFDSGAVLLNSTQSITITPPEVDVLLNGTGFSTLTSNSFVAEGGATNGRIRYTGVSGKRCIISVSITAVIVSGSELLASIYRNGVLEIQYGYNYISGRKNSNTYTYLTTVNTNDIFDVRFQSIDGVVTFPFNNVVMTLQLLQS